MFSLLSHLQDDGMTPEMAMEVRAEFDSSVKKALADRAKNTNNVIYNLTVSKTFSSLNFTLNPSN